MKYVQLRRAIPAILMIVVMCASAFAEQYQGTVKFGGVPVPGAVVTATQNDKKVTTVTDDGGVYTFADLASGAWNVQVEMAGFAKQSQDVTIAAGLPPGAWELKMLSMAEMAAMPAASAPVAVAEIKPAGAAVAPNAPPANAAANGNRAPAAAPASGGFQRTDVRAASGAAAAANDAPAFVNESAGDLAQRAADGLLVNGSVNNGAASPFAQLAAFGNNRRTRSLYTGAFGLVMDNSVFDARSFSLTGLDQAKPQYNYMVGSFSFQGPMKFPGLIKANPPQIFFGYQRTQNRGATVQSGLMPTLDQRNGDLSAFGKSIIDPQTGQAFSGNIIPPERISAQARALMSYFPLPNFTAGTQYNYQIPVLTTTHQDGIQTRITKALSPKNQLFGDFSFQRTAADNTNVLAFLDTTQTYGIVGSANWTHRSGQRFSTTVRYQFSRLSNRVTPNFSNRLNVSGAAGINGNNQEPLYWGPPTLVFSGGINSLSDGVPVFNRNQTNAFSYSNLWIRSPHTFTFGGDFRRQQANILSQQDPRGTFTFTGDYSGSDFADFLLGYPRTMAISYLKNADKYLRQNVYDLFINDDWRVRTGLTLTLGLRWDYEAPSEELFGRIVNLDITPGFTSASVVKGQSLNPDRNGIQPRMAFAWRPLAASSLVVRGGYGVYRNSSVYQAILTQMAQQPLTTDPQTKVFNQANCDPSQPSTAPCRPYVALGNALTIPTQGTPTFAVDPNFRIGYAQSWNLSVQRDLPASLQMTATYAGSKGTRLMQEFVPNTYPTGVVNPCPTCPTNFYYLSSNGNSTRESGQVQLRRRLRNGLTANVQYTLAKSIDDAGFSATNPQLQLIAQNWLDLRADRALSTFDQRHQVVASAQYTTGMGSGAGALLSGWRGAIYKEWTATAAITTGSGSPLTPIYLNAVHGTGITGSIRPNYTGQPIYTDGANGVYLNSAAYTAPAPGQWGNAGRDSIIGPRQFIMNASFARTIRVNDRVNADLRIDANNVLNHVTFQNWIAFISSKQFGAPAAPSQMRKITTSVRLRF
jgi:hypothetical protein